MSEQPVVPELRAALMRAAEAQLTPAAGAGRRGTRWRKRWGGLPMIAVILIGTGGIATATGLVVSQATKDRSEQLAKEPTPPAGKFSSLGEQMVATAREVQAELPYPPGMRDEYDWSKYSIGATLGAGGEVRREIQLMSETRAKCIWLRYYVKAHDRGDRRAMTDAAGILARAPHWPATRRLTERSDPDDPNSGLSHDLAHAQMAARGELSGQMRHEIMLNCTDGIDPRLRQGESQAEGLARIKREARASGE